jgi:NAD(P)-dependent dehydrogenase (short-subunit alcohol dehydrogenase family)
VPREHWPVRDKVVFITGAARGIGLETARELKRRGARVSLVGLEPELLERNAKELDAPWFEADVRDWDALEAASAGTVEQLGGIDVVIANAGIAPQGTVETIDRELWEATIDINLTGVFRTIRTTLPHVRERRGYVLPIASLAAAVHGPMLSHYHAAKAGVEALGNSLRSEVAHTGTKVGVAYFSFIDTDMVREGRASRIGQLMEARTGSFLSRPAPISQVGPRIADGVESRARHVTLPRYVGPMLPVRAALQRLVEFGSRRQGISDAIDIANEEARHEGGLLKTER